MLKEIPSEWCPVTDLKPGDKVLWWAQVCEIKDVRVGPQSTTIVFSDYGNYKGFEYDNTQKLRKVSAD
jgi:hypothetical protein